MTKGKQAQEMGQEMGQETGQGPRPLRYVDPNYTIPGVPARDLTAEEAARYGAKIAAAQAASRVVIYEEV